MAYVYVPIVQRELDIFREVAGTTVGVGSNAESYFLLAFQIIYMTTQKNMAVRSVASI